MSEGADYTLKGVEVFLEGEHRNKTYTSKDLDDLVANFRRLNAAGKLRVPLVIGHEEDQQYLRRSDLPAAGWATHAYREGDRVKMDFDHVPDEVARLFRGKALRGISAEVYDQPPQGCDGNGKTFRRIAGLGGDQPQIKGLADIPTPERMSESGRRFASLPLTIRNSHAVRLPDGCYAVFSEVAPMDRDALMAKMAEHGADPAVIGNMPDNHLAHMAEVLDKKETGSMGDDHLDKVVGAYGEDDADIGDLPADDEGAAKFRERAARAKRFAERFSARAKRFAEKCGESDATPDPLKKGLDKMSEQVMRKLIREELKAGADGAVGRLEKFAEDQVKSQKKLAVDALIAELDRAGKVPPREREAERQTLMLLDDSVVHKFSEGGKTSERTLFDHHVARLKARPSKFGEHFGGGTNGNGNGGDDSVEVEKVERFSETPLFAKALDAAGKTPQQYVDGFKAARKANPALTAEQYGVHV
jgi:hypothetical protein